MFQLFYGFFCIYCLLAMKEAWDAFTAIFNFFSALLLTLYFTSIFLQNLYSYIKWKKNPWKCTDFWFLEHFQKQMQWPQSQLVLVLFTAFQQGQGTRCCWYMCSTWIRTETGIRIPFADWHITPTRIPVNDANKYSSERANLGDKSTPSWLSSPLW